MHIYDDLDLLAVDLINSRLERAESVYTFSSGVLRGRLENVEVIHTFPSSTYLAAKSPLDTQSEPCVVLTYTPAPRSRVQPADPSKINFTRKPTTFRIPVRFYQGALSFVKITEGKWMLNINTSVKQ